MEGSAPRDLNHRDGDNSAISRGSQEDGYEESREEDARPHDSQTATNGGSSTVITGIDANPNVVEAVAATFLLMEEVAATKPPIMVVVAMRGGEEAVAQEKTTGSDDRANSGEDDGGCDRCWL